MICRWWRPYGCDRCEVAWRGRPVCWVCGGRGVERLLPIMNGASTYEAEAA